MAAPKLDTIEAWDVLVGDVIYSAPSWLYPDGAQHRVARITHQLGDELESTGRRERCIRFDLEGGGVLVVRESDVVQLVCQFLSTSKEA